MSLLAWLLVGVGCGLLANLVARHYGPAEDVIVGVVGSIGAGWVFLVVAGAPVTNTTPFDAASSLIGSVTLLALSRTLTQGRSTI